MANPEHLEILKQGIEVWNKWREDNPDIDPNLAGISFDSVDLSGAYFEKTNFRGANLTKADFICAYLTEANLSMAILKEANLSGAELTAADIRGATLTGANLSEIDAFEANFEEANLVRANLNKANIVRSNFNMANLSEANLRGANFSHSNLNEVNLWKSNLIDSVFVEANLRGANINRANLYGANLYSADLSKSNLRGADLIRADLRNSNITDVNLYGTARDNWKIDNITCDYVYFDEERIIRIPNDRDFLSGEFEELYKQLPTFDYYFEHGFTPIDAVVMDQVVTAINEKNSEIELKLDSFHSRGQPHAKFTVLHKESIDEVRKQVAKEYEGKLKYIEGQRDQILELFTKTINEPRTVIGQVTGSVNVNKKEIEHMSGDTFNVSNVSGANINLKSRLTNVQQNIQNSDASDDLKARLEELAKAVEAMTGKMPEDRAKEVKDDLELFVKGATENKPKWYSVSGEGLIEAAKAIGSLGKPVIESAQAVLKLLA